MSTVAPKEGETSSIPSDVPSSVDTSSSSTSTKKAPPPNLVVPPKKPKLTKAERRALQEQQRAAKAGGANIAATPSQTKQQEQQPQANAPVKTDSNKTTTASSDEQKQQPSTYADTAKISSLSGKSEINDPKKSKQISHLSHLPPYRDPHDHSELFFSIRLGGTPHVINSSNIKSLPSAASHHPSYHNLHPAVLQTGRLYATGSILGANARCRAMLRALAMAIADCQPPPNGDIRNHINNQILKPSFAYWTNECRPHSISMGNAFAFVKSAVVAASLMDDHHHHHHQQQQQHLNQSRHSRDMTWSEYQKVLLESMEAYVQERIDYADVAIASMACDKISHGDVILTYSHSDAIRAVLLEAHNTRKTKFRVIVVDSKPLLEGKIMVRALRQAGLECTYVLLNALSYVMKDVTKVFLGAKALMSDGSVYGRVGTACVALSAKDIPVLVCAETYKISNRIQLEAITYNELGNPQQVVKGKLGDNLRVINLLFDLTPASFISGIITEMGILPPSSVAVLLREMNPQDSYNSGF